MKNRPQQPTCRSEKPTLDPVNPASSYTLDRAVQAIGPSQSREVGRRQKWERTTHEQELLALGRSGHGSCCTRDECPGRQVESPDCSGAPIQGRSILAQASAAGK